MLKLITFAIAIASIIVSQLSATEPLKAGTYAQNINPTTFPVWVNGNIAGVKGDRIHDPLHARCLVLGQGTTKLAICIVDNCILPIDLVDQARNLAAEKTGIPINNILVAATHSHSAVSVARRTRDTHSRRLRPTITNLDRRWYPTGGKQYGGSSSGLGQRASGKVHLLPSLAYEKGSLTATPFTGRNSDEVFMNPGYDNPNKLAPVGPVDRTIPILSIQTLEGKPLAVLASFSTHYAGSPALSADYFGVVANRLTNALCGDTPEKFLGIMANGTSGDANCIDFSKPREPFTHIDVGNYVAELILSELPNIEHRANLTLDAAFTSLTLNARVPTEAEVAEAQKYIETHFPIAYPNNG
jgi:hypothetical protein